MGQRIDKTWHERKNTEIPIWKIKYKQKFEWVKFVIYFFHRRILGGADLVWIPPKVLLYTNHSWINYDKMAYVILVS
jgi:hypothetical protein